MENTDVLVYLDHNVLDLMTKDDPHKVKIVLAEDRITPVYSDESIKEIHRSKGYEHLFLDLLEEIGAKYIEPILDEKFKQTGTANIHTLKPHECYQRFLENLNDNPEGDFGISDMLIKFYGGKENATFEDIFSSGNTELHKYLQEILEDVDDGDIPEELMPELEKLRACITDLPDMLKAQNSFAVEELSKLSKSPMREFEEATSLGPIVLKNITPPDVVTKVWDLLSKKMNTPNVELETFFGVKPHDFEEDSDRERTLLEKVNGIYHQLNFLGYYRDSNMKKERRFRASFSDMTHAGVASFCHFFFCRDKDLVMKAEAAYEYLGVQTRIVHFQTSKATPSNTIKE